MQRYLKRFILLLALLLVPVIGTAKQISLLVIDADTYLINQAFKKLELPESVELHFYTHADITGDPAARAYIDASDIIIVDVMMNDLAEYLIEKVDISSKKIFAVRGSRDDERLKSKGFVFDPVISEYFSHLSAANMRNMIRCIVNREIDASVDFQPVKKLERLGLYHPDAANVFTRYDDYHHWYVKRSAYNGDHPTLGLMIFSSNLMAGQVEAVDYVIRRLETAGFNVVCCFGRGLDVITSFLMDPDRNARVDLVLSFSLKFYSAINDSLRIAIEDLNVPIFNLVNLYAGTIAQWRQDPKGIPPMDVVWAVANPEISGAVEPTPVSGKVEERDAQTGRSVFHAEPIRDNLENLIPRLKMWVNLQRKNNAAKKVAILYYNHSQGKQNIGASYLNVFRSLELILERMKTEGYRVESDQRISEDSLKEMVLRYGRNIGSWAPGELDRMLLENKVVRLPVQTYRQWFDQLPQDFRDNVIRQWGPVEDSAIMIKDQELIVPAVKLGNGVILPEPSRGWGDDPMKLYHEPTLYPHHQYIAAYLWLKHEFQADAMIHLGTHATHEWLPGKQAGLSTACPPEVLVTDIPNLYPYIVDDVGEGIQAKRRGRGVVIDHMIPPMVENDLYHEYTHLYDLISGYNRSLSLGSDTVSAKREEIESLSEKLGLKADLRIMEFDDEAMEEIEHYLLDIKANLLPYGLHTFGRSPEGQALEDTVQCIVKHNASADETIVRQGMTESGRNEIDNLIKGLNGGFIPSGEGNDPLRNPAALPTGRNFFGFNPSKIPSRAAWKLGKTAAEQMIQKSLDDGKGVPQKVAVVLWATETLRNEGVNESTILYLMGLKPVWDRVDRVTGVQVITGKQLNRPRIDVLMNPSGLYRDLFPNMMLMLDDAVQKAAVQDDIENLIARHSREIKTRLIQSGMDAEQAETASKIRIFTEKPGSYGTGVSEMTGASGFWESEDEIVKVYENRSGYAFGLGKWGEPAKQLFRENLKGVDTAVHSRSSNLYGTMDNDDVFQYLGGLSMAVRIESGRAPQTLMTVQQKKDQVDVEDIAKTIGRELRTRYLNPKWIEGMKKEDYAGARQMSNFVEYMWGWQVTVPHAVDAAKWKQTYEVYVEDKYGLDIREFIDQANPWAYQSITARMLETVRKKYWQPDEKVTRKLAVDYAMNVVDKGVACCDHTCNNPVLNQMVVNIVSLPGVMSPEMVEKFKLAIEKAAGETLADQVNARIELQKQLTAEPPKPPQTDTPDTRSDSQKSLSEKPPQPKAQDPQPSAKASAKENSTQPVEGYKMEDLSSEDETTDLASSGVQWLASVFVMALIGLFVWGLLRSRIH